ncbi:fimbrillin family protein [Segatella paludivivens]|uniref:fimbrillin family protein n=1 Tax=Segatella paludivivens TaxID=185294 RepID=UPI00039B25B1|nr:fimbrillin family protein [Segatella paludivivens]
MGKKFLRGINESLLLLIIISTFCSCANEMNVFEENNNKQINFSISVPEWKNTDSLGTTKTSRAMPVGGTSLSTSNIFNLIADQNDGAGNYTTIINSQAVSYTNNIWKISKDYYWSGIANKTISFYAYFPSTISNVSHTAGSSPTLSYTVPDNVSDQIDIMTATNNNVSGNTNTSTPLTFNHIFAAVKFCSGSLGLPSGNNTILKIKGVQYKGIYTFNNGWVNSADRKDFYQNVNLSTFGVSTNITNDGATFMMLPQTFSNITIEVTYNNGLVLSKTISGKWEANNVYTYNLSKTITTEYGFNGNYQTFTAPYSGVYKIECWGASGGDLNTYKGGKGAYTNGNITLNKDQLLYLYIGELGGRTSNPSTPFNSGSCQTDNGIEWQWGRAGGGATDIRLVSGTWNDFNSLKSRIMVAGGGGGADNRNCTEIGSTTSPYYGDGNGGYGGALIGGDGTTENHINPLNNIVGGYFTDTGATQTSAGYCTAYLPYTNSGYGGGFGFSNGNAQAGGGGGYYGGASLLHCGGSGGSSFISGYLGCNAIDPSSTSDKILHTGSSVHYSKFIFTNSQMIAGNASMPSPSGGTEIGHTGNGHARITFISAN